MHCLVIVGCRSHGFLWILRMVRIFPFGCRCVLVYLGRWPSALCFAWRSPASDGIPSGAVYICRRVCLSVGRVLYVLGESWNGMGLGIRWVVCTVNCGGTHYYTILMLILRITVYYRVMPSVVHAWRHSLAGLDTEYRPLIRFVKFVWPRCSYIIYLNDMFRPFHGHLQVE